MYGIRDFLEIMFPVFLIVVIVVGAIAGMVAVAQKNYCNTMERLHTDFEFIYDFWAGCLVKTPSGYWIDAGEYQYLEGDVR